MHELRKQRDERREMMGNEKPKNPEEGWVWAHLLVLQRGHGAPHPLPLRLHLGGLLPRVLLVLLGHRSPLLDPESAGGEMLSLGITSKKVCVYKVFFLPRAVPTKPKIYLSSGSSESWKGHTGITELFHRQCMLKRLFLGRKS